MHWTTQDELVGQRVFVYTGFGDEELATVLAVNDTVDLIRVETEDGDVLVGNQWEPAE